MGEHDAGAFDGLPPAIGAIVPELRGLPAGESRSTCATCALAPERMSEAARAFAFTAGERCCTYHPELANYLVGRALARGGRGAELVRSRLANADGVTANGIGPDAGWRERKATSAAGFGRDPALRCPYWSGGELACAIWPDRNAICRTWFCRCEHGGASRRRWHGARAAVTATERALAAHCVEVGEPPGARSAVAEWERWYRWCAERVESLSDAEVEVIATGVGPARAAFSGALAEQVSALADVVVAEISDIAVDARGNLAVCGYSSHDPIDAPAELLDFIDALDGARTWRAAAGLAGIGDELVAELHRIDALRPPRSPLAGDVPAVLVPAMQAPLPAGDRVVLRGQSLRGCVVAPGTIFELIARLDGARPWRPLLGDRPASLIERLYRIGALEAPP